MALLNPGMFNHNCPTPLYVQVADQVQRLIWDGALKPGEKLPSEHDLADAAGIGYITFRSVARELRARGLINSVIGKGTFVAENPPRTPRRQASFR